MSVIDSLFLHTDGLATIALSSFLLFGLFFIILTIFIHILTFLLSRRLDSIVFNDKYFSLGEISMLSLWPFSLFKSSYYTFLITFPNFARKKRFKGLQTDLPIEPPLRMASEIYMYLYILTALVGIVMFVSMFTFYIVGKFF